MASIDFNQAQINKALLNFKKANYKESIKILENLNKSQSHFLIHWYLGHSYFRIYDYLSAKNNIKKSIKLKKPDILNLSFLAEIHLKCNEYDESVKLFEEVLKIDHKNIQALFSLAKIHVEIGNLANALSYYNKIIKLDPTSFEAMYELTKINPDYLNNDLLIKLKKKKDLNNLENFNKIYLNFILAEKYRLDKNFEKEIQTLIEAHNIYAEKKINPSNQEFNYFTNLLPKFMKKIKNTNLALDCELSPIFVMGLPRSGTTLIENIISSSDNKIFLGGETEVLSKVFFSENIISNYDSKDLKLGFSFRINDFERLKEKILNQYTQQRIDLSQKIFTDKSLENFLYIDFITKIFPKAKFVYCKRDKYANFLGILKVFLPNLLWSHSIDKIISMMNLYESKLKEILSEKKIRLKVINIENFTNHSEEISKELFNFLELSWNSKILDLKVNQKKIIKTKSNLQVRNKIIKHNLEYLDDYIPFLRKFGIDQLI